MSAKEDIGVFILALLAISTIYFYQTKTCNSDPTNLYLSSPIVIPTNSSANDDLRNSTYWKLVLTEWGNGVVQLVPQTVIGYIDRSQEWKNWAQENLPYQPLWLQNGFLPYAQSQVTELESGALFAPNSSAAARVIQGFASSIYGYSLAAFDLISFNGLTALRTYLGTGSLVAAACSTYPAQLAQLYSLAFDPTVSSDVRAHDLGEALAVTSVMAAVGGVAGFSDDFQAALGAAGLSDVWDAIKPSLADIGGSVSPSAGALTVEILQEEITRFPENTVWEAGVTADRISSMVDVLHDDGVPSSEIQQKIAGLVQAAESSSGPNYVATEADLISYQSGGGISVKIGSQNRLFLYSDGQTMDVLQADFLREVVPGFTLGSTAIVAIHYLQRGVTVYHQYIGGDNWIPTVPASVGKSGDIVTITFHVLTPSDFVSSLPRLTLGNEVDASWMSDIASANSYSLQGDDLTIEFSQEPQVQGASTFAVNGVASRSMGFDKGDTFLAFSVEDVFGNSRPMKITFDGYGSPVFGIQSSHQFYDVLFFSSDGVRFKAAYDAGGPDNIKVATIYFTNPSSLYSLGTKDYNLPVNLQGSPYAFQIKDTTLNRQLEKSMLTSNSDYDVGRLGAEIAHSAGEQELGLKGLVISEPSQGGPDLYTTDGSVVMQARLLTVTQLYTNQQIDATILEQLKDMNGQIQLSFASNPSAMTGYLVFSYVNNDGQINTIVVEVPRS